jgi:hypothetical protein
MAALWFSKTLFQTATVATDEATTWFHRLSNEFSWIYLSIKSIILTFLLFLFVKYYFTYKLEWLSYDTIFTNAIFLFHPLAHTCSKSIISFMVFSWLCDSSYYTVCLLSTQSALECIHFEKNVEIVEYLQNWHHSLKCDMRKRIHQQTTSEGSHIINWHQSLYCKSVLAFSVSCITNGNITKKSKNTMT